MQNGQCQNELDGRAQVLHHADDGKRKSFGGRSKEHERHNGDHTRGGEKPEVSGTLTEESHLSLRVEHQEGGNAEGRQDESL